VERVRWARPGVVRNQAGEETSASLRADVEAVGAVCVTEWNDALEEAVSRRSHLPCERTYSPLRPPDFFNKRMSPMTTDLSTALTMS